jgi:hypothetical protein
MEILAPESAWLTVDEEQLAKLLDTPFGKRLIGKLSEAIPPMFEDGSRNKLLLRMGKIAGVQHAIESLFLMAHPPKKSDASQHSEYPSPENDAAWNDGKKLEPEPEKPPVEDII